MLKFICYTTSFTNPICKKILVVMFQVGECSDAKTCLKWKIKGLSCLQILLLKLNIGE